MGSQRWCYSAVHCCKTILLHLLSSHFELYKKCFWFCSHLKITLWPRCVPPTWVLINNVNLLSVPLCCVCVCVYWAAVLIVGGEGKPVVGHLCDSSISAYHPFTLSICPCPSLFLSLSPFLSFSLSVTHTHVLLTSNFTSPPQGYRTSATKTVSVWMRVLFSDARPPQNINVAFFFVSTSPLKHFKVFWLPLSLAGLNQIRGWLVKCPYPQHTASSLLLWLINFPDQACPTIKCSPSLCHTQSVPALSCVSLPSLADFSSLWPLIAFT